MKVIRKRKSTLVIELEEWEARQLASILNRIKKQQFVGKSEFSLNEKITGRRLESQLGDLITKES